MTMQVIRQEVGARSRHWKHCCNVLGMEFHFSVPPPWPRDPNTRLATACPHRNAQDPSLVALSSCAVDTVIKWDVQGSLQ